MCTPVTWTPRGELQAQRVGGGPECCLGGAVDAAEAVPAGDGVHVDEDRPRVGGQDRREGPRQEDGPKKLISMFARMSASVTSSRLALGGFAPALFMRARDIGRGGHGGGDRLAVGDVEGERDDALVVPGAGCAGGGVDLRGAAGESLVHEVGSDAAVCSGDQDDCSIGEGMFMFFLLVDRLLVDHQPQGGRCRYCW
jgi:hypothetical protein